MRILWSTPDGRSHRIELTAGDVSIFSLVGFQQFHQIAHMTFAPSHNPWMPAVWLDDAYTRLEFALRMERDLLPYSYAADGDAGGCQSVMIDHEDWSLVVGPGECAISHGSSSR